MPDDDASTATAASDRDLDARLQQALHEYFATPRMLAQGDLVVLPLPPPPPAPRRWGIRPRTADTVHLQVTLLSSHDGASALVSRVHTRLVLQGSVSTMLPPSLLQYVRSDASAEASTTGPELVSAEHGHPRATLSARGAAPLSAAAAAVVDLLTPCVHITGAALRVRASLLLQGPLGARPPSLDPLLRSVLSALATRSRSFVT